MIKFAKILLVILCYTPIAGFGQELKNTDLTNDWKLLSEKNGLKLFVKSETCQIQGAPKPFDYVFIKLENTNLEDKTIDFQLGVIYQEKCIGCSLEDNEAKRRLTIPANTTWIGENTFEKGELSYLITNHNGLDKSVFKSIQLIYLNIQ